MDGPPSQQLAPWARVKRINKVALPKALHVLSRLWILVSTGVIAAFVVWIVWPEHFRGQTESFIAIVAAYPIIFLIAYSCEFLRGARRIDRPVVRVVWEAGVVCLCVGFGWFAWSKLGEIDRLTNAASKERGRLTEAASKERAERIDIAKAALRLEQLRKDKEQFEQAVKLADAMWEKVEQVGKGELAASPNPISVPYALASSMRLWSNALGQVRSTARKTLGEQTGIGDIEGHTANFKITVPVQGDGEEVISNDWNRRLWREAYDRHLKAQEFVGSILDRINSEINQLTQQVAAAAQQDGR
jgi:hypothetical protein